MKVEKFLNLLVLRWVIKSQSNSISIYNNNSSRFPPDPMTCLIITYQTGNGSRYVFHLVEQVSNPNKKWFVTFLDFMPLWNQKDVSPGQLLILFYRVKSWV